LIQEVEMTNRPTRFLRAVFTGIVACASLAIIAPGAAAAPGECVLAKPRNAAPPGQYWLHLNDWLNNRHCWVLRAKLGQSQAKGARPAQAALAAVTVPTRTTAFTAADSSPIWADVLANDEGKGPSEPFASPAIAERADQNPQDLAPPVDAKLPPPTLQAPEPTPTLSAPSEQSASPAIATQIATLVAPQVAAPTQNTNQQASIGAESETVSAAVKTTPAAFTLRGPNPLQMLLLAIFCGPALYLVAAGTIRRLQPAKSESAPLPYMNLDGYMSLDDASAYRALLPPRLEPNENTVSS
jgi:hypothetical protein